MSNDVIVVPKQPATVVMVPRKAVKQDLITETNTIVYMPLATTQNPGVVQIGEGLTIDVNGVLSFDKNEITISQIAKNGEILVPDEHKVVNIVLNKTDVGLNNVDNTADINKPVSVYQQEALDKKLNSHQGRENSGKYLFVNPLGNISFKNVDRLTAHNKDGEISNAVEQLRFTEAFTVRANQLVSDDVLSGDELIIDVSPEFKNSIHNVAYDSNTGVLTFSKVDGTELKVDLPLELLIKSGRFDESTGEIVLELANHEEIRIPVKELINQYYADETTLELINSDGVLSFRIKDNGVTAEKIQNGAVTSDKIVSLSGDKVVGPVASATRATQDENGDNISTTYQKIENSYNKTETDDLLGQKANVSDLPVVIRLRGV